MLPRTVIQKTDGNTGAVRPSPAGNLAIIAPGATGTQNLAASFFRQDLISAQFGNGKLVEYAALDLAVSGNPVLCIRPITSNAATYGAITNGITGTSVPTAGATAPLDDYDVLITFLDSFTIGTGPGRFTYSLDRGNTTSAIQQMGTATSITPNVVSPQGIISSSGVTLNFSVGTVNAGDTVAVSVKSASMNASDLNQALEALRITKAPWEGVLIDGDLGTGTVAQVDTWLAGLEATGKFRFAVMNTRHKNLPVPTGETEAAYAAAITSLVQNQASIRCCVGADGGYVQSPVTGLLMFRPTSLAVASRAMLIPIGEDPAFVGRGNVPFAIAGSDNNPLWHNEELYPGLDDQRVATLRTIEGENGVFITNANVISPAGSDFVFLQHVRTMNRACEIAYQVLTKQLSIGVGKKPKDPITGGIYIREEDAQRIEGLVNAEIRRQLKRQVADALFVLSRTDDLSSNAGATVTAELQLEALAYIKKFLVTAKFVRSITVNV